MRLTVSLVRTWLKAGDERTGCTGGFTLSETTNWTAGDLNGYSGSNLTMR